MKALLLFATGLLVYTSGFSQNVGINNPTPQFPLSFNGTSGDKISLWNDGTATHYGMGIQSSLFQIFSKNPIDNIAFGYGSSSSFTERMRIINSGGSGMELKGRILLMNGTLPLDINYGPGIWLNKADNSALLGFMGTQNNQNIGFYGGPGGWGFTYDALNSRVGIGTTTPNASAILELRDSTKGFLPPRMTSVQRDAIPSPVAGLQIWCIDCKQLQVYDGSVWRTASDVTTYYPIVGICCQSWMTKNLDVATYRNGDPIPKVTDNAAWAALTTGAYCYYDNDSTTYAATYGKLYNWYAVNDPRGLAPMGWHIPTDFEWTTLSNCLGGATVAGGAMKEIGTTHWQTPNTGATNISGFTGLPGGNRNSGTFNGDGSYGGWWSSTEGSTLLAWYRYMNYSDGNVGRSANDKRNGFSVRCLRD